MYYCKLCGKEIISKLVNHQMDCDCQSYSVTYTYTGVIDIEVIRSGNYYLVFFPAYKDASVVEKPKDQKHRVLKHFTMEELSKEEAALWLVKLKKYLTFS